MFLGITSSRRSFPSRLRRYRLRRAIATAFFAGPCPTMYRSSSSTIWRGVRSCMALLSYRLNHNLVVRVDTQAARDLEGFSRDGLGGQIGVTHQSERGGVRVR